MPLLAAALVALLLLAAPARAAGPEVGIADDRVLLAGGPRADRAVAEWRALGVGVVRIFALWSRIAPASRPPGFDGADPAAPGYQWPVLDAAVDRVRAAGMRPMLTITGPGPLWSSRSPRLGRPAYRPSPSAYAAFATAVARRYGDRVDRYILWNEPNIATWLTAPDRPLQHPDDVDLAELDDLERVLGRLRRGGALRGAMGIYVDEYGYQTRPPDRAAGVRPARQDRWLQRAAYEAWRNPRVRLLTQYLWRDEPRSGDGSFGGWQSGLRFAGGRAKPSLAHFDTPFVVDGRRRRLWGQVRPGGAHVVTVERRLRGRAWRRLARVRTDARGYWALRRRPTPGARYRYRAAGLVSAMLRP